MASSALSLISGIAAAAAGLAGDKVAKDGAVPGLDLATIIPALLGKSGGAGGILGTLASVASKTGLLNSSNMGKLAELAGSLISSSGKAGGAKTAATGIAGLAAAIAGGTGSGSNLASIASMAAKLAGTVKGGDKGLTSMATELGSTLASKFGVSFEGSASAITGLSKVLEGDTKSKLFTAILKGLV